MKKYLLDVMENIADTTMNSSYVVPTKLPYTYLAAVLSLLVAIVFSAACLIFVILFGIFYVVEHGVIRPMYRKYKGNM